VALEKNALQDAKKAILGTWTCSTGGKMTFNPDDTVSIPLLSKIYTYKFVDSTHLTITGLYGLAFSSDYDANLTGPDQYLRWHGVVCHHDPK
jgi:hypothetical protein